MPRRTTRREFVRQTAAAGFGFWAGNRWLHGEPAVTKSANQKLNVAVIGIAGQGKWNTESLVNTGMVNLVAFADVDEKHCAPTRQQFPNVPLHHDYRKLIDRRDIDAVLVATPDHSHAGPTLMAMNAGKHVYCEKPLCHTIEEVRVITATARKSGVATQMGTQIHSGPNYRRVVELIKSGVIGQVREVHVWCHRNEWGSFKLPTEKPPVPQTLQYDLWLGPAAERPYSPAYLPQRWRGWWDFGGGVLADMACHHLDLSFWALDLLVPRTVEASAPTPVDEYSCPTKMTATWEFDARGDLPPVKLTWYHGDNVRPPHFHDGVPPKMPKWGDGTLFVGSEGWLLADYDQHVLLPEENFGDLKRPEPFIADSVGHHKEWLLACKGGKPALCRFEYGGPLTEAVLLGNVAFKTGKKLEWDPKQLRVQNAPEAEQLIRKEYRKGWELNRDV